MRRVPVDGSDCPLSKNRLEHLNCQVNHCGVVALKLSGGPAEELLCCLRAWLWAGAQNRSQDLACLQWHKVILVSQAPIVVDNMSIVSVKLAGACYVINSELLQPCMVSLSLNLTLTLTEVRKGGWDLSWPGRESMSPAPHDLS